MLEAHQAQAQGVEQVRIEGPATQLVTGERGAALKAAELEAAAAEKEAKTAAKAAFENALAQDDPQAKADADESAKEQQRRIDEAKGKAAEAQLDVLVAPAAELIDLANATCSMEADKVAIREQIRGSEVAITDQIATLIRANIAGRERAADPNIVDGPLGPLQVNDKVLVIPDGKLAQPASCVQLAQWMWSRPKAEELTIGGELAPNCINTLCLAYRMKLLDPQLRVRWELPVHSPMWSPATMNIGLEPCFALAPQGRQGGVSANGTAFGEHAHRIS